MDKKYYSISQVAKILAVKEHTLRNLDGILGKKLTIIRGRRHYTASDIEKLQGVISGHLSSRAYELANADPGSSKIIAPQELKINQDALFKSKISRWIPDLGQQASKLKGDKNLENLMRSMQELRAELVLALK